MNPLGTRTRVQELARLLDGAVAGPAVLTAGHAALATRLRAVTPALAPGSTPRPEFRAQLRQRLVAVATVQAAAAADAPYAAPLPRPRAFDAALAWTHSQKAQRRLGVTAGAMAGVVAFTGVGVAASRSLPGQPFYGLKRTAEDVQLQFASGDTDRGVKHLEFAATRLREVRALAGGDSELALAASGGLPTASGSRSDRMADTLAAFDHETKAGSHLLVAVFRATGKPEPLRILQTFSTEQRSRLTALLPTLPAAVQDDAQHSLALISSVGKDANQLLALGTCSGECYPQPVPSISSGPVPAPGATAAPGGDNNGVPACVCGRPTPTPDPATTSSTTTSGEPTGKPSAGSTPTPAPTGTASPATSPAPGPLPTALTTLLPTPIPTLPVPTTLLDPLITPLASPLATLLPQVPLLP
jgi:hypothetical protein